MSSAILRAEYFYRVEKKRGVFRIIDPKDITDWDEYYNDVATLDEILEHDEECVSDACELIDAFSTRFQYDIVGFLITRWLTPKVHIKNMQFSDVALFDNSYDVVKVSVAESHNEISPKIASQANDLSARYIKSVEKLRKHASDYANDWFETYSSLLSETLLEKVYDADEVEVTGTDWLDSSEGELDESESSIVVANNSIVYLALDEVHYLRMPFVAGSFVRGEVEPTEMSADIETRDIVLRGEGKKLDLTVYVVDNPSDKVRVESLVAYVFKYLNRLEE